jgi:hypothetical protein
MTHQKQYSDLLHLLDNVDTNKEDVYTQLMKKEDNVLNVLSRMSTQDDKKTLTSSMFLSLSINDIIARFAYTWQNIFIETIIDHNIENIPYTLFQNERKIYVGIMLVLVSLFLYFATL